MFKLMVGLVRRPDLTKEAFLHFWLHEHGPLVHKHAAVRRIARYVQIHPAGGSALQGVVEKRGGLIAPYDGIAEIYWNSLEDMHAANQTEEGRAAGVEIVEHERQFLDLPKLQFFLGEEHVFKP